MTPARSALIRGGKSLACSRPAPQVRIVPADERTAHTAFAEAPLMVEVQFLHSAAPAGGDSLVPDLSGLLETVQTRRVMWFGADLRLRVDPLHFFHGRKTSSTSSAEREGGGPRAFEEDSVLVLKAEGPSGTRYVDVGDGDMDDVCAYLRSVSRADSRE